MTLYVIYDFNINFTNCTFADMKIICTLYPKRTCHLYIFYNFIIYSHTHTSQYQLALYDKLSQTHFTEEDSESHRSSVTASGLPVQMWLPGGHVSWGARDNNLRVNRCHEDAKGQS